ncbi:hypothetical protein B0J18DRAFT_146775 [Chaetomium sp. MPI-SDFR-AT-0129]|nr:hypothetical protein B0J18DRAFT_146775 [Chaetomium sp. MPI-SDFR-AT-0129]
MRRRGGTGSKSVSKHCRNIPRGGSIEACLNLPARPTLSLLLRGKSRAPAEQQLPVPGFAHGTDSGLSAVTVPTSTALHIHLSAAPPQHARNLSHPLGASSAFEQIGLETAVLTKEERLAMYLSHDVPFAAFRLPQREGGNPSSGHVHQTSQAVFSRTTVSFDTVISTVADSFLSAPDPTEPVTGVGDATMPSGHRYPTDILFADLHEPSTSDSAIPR